MVKREIILFHGKEDCCGCGACLNSCPQNAISMKEDSYGNVFPEIEENLCVRCGKCISACGYKKDTVGQTPIKVYAAAAKEDMILQISSSGGAFAALATKILEQSGVVFGCATEFTDKTGIQTCHIMVENLSELKKIQGSKYVKSDMVLCYREVLKQLNTGRKVLFSGTPCQVDGLNGFLGRKLYDNLITVDIICHGVPGEKLFRDYIAEEEKKLGMRICDVEFRNKKDGWGSFVLAEHCRASDQKKISRFLYARQSSYYWLFLKGATYRDSCYSCKYAGGQRFSDLTIGDFWGIEEMHPEYLQKGLLNAEKGISCILVNTEKGQSFLETCRENMILLDSTYEAAAKRNGQLNHSTKRHESREAVMELYCKNGYAAVDEWYRKHLGMKYYLYQVWDWIPRRWKNIVKKCLNR